ncbi:MAG: 5'-nucleotidase [Planctomycetota bacterium]
MRVLGPLALVLLLALPALAGDHPVLPLDSLGIVNRDTEPAGRRINDLKLFDGKLFIGTGDYSVNTGPMDILALDPKTGKVTVEGQVDDEAVAVFRVVDGKLVIPGPDATESWELGNLYVRGGDGAWAKHRSVPHGIHVQDVISWRGRWWAATGSYVEPVKDDGIGCGAVLSSEDRGATWRFEAISRADRQGFARYGWLTVFQDRLYAFPYHLAQVPTERIPEEFRPSDAPAHMMFVPDPMGAADVLVTDGGAWRPVDLVPVPDVIKVSPIPFGDRLVLSVVTGKHVPSYADTIQKNRGLPKGAEAKLFVFDGETTKPVDLAHDFLVDAAAPGDTLFLLILRDGKYLLAASENLVDWSIVEPAVGAGHALSIEHADDAWYVGMKDGNLLRQSGPVVDDSVPQPASYEILADLPRDTVGAWAAISAMESPGGPARMAVSRMGSTIRVTTKGVEEFVIFLGDLGITGEVTLQMGDVRTVVPGGGGTALFVKRVESGWGITRGAGSARTFEPKPLIVAVAAVPLTRAGPDPTIGLLVADAIRATAKADVAFINRGTVRRDLPAGPIHATTVHDLVYRNRVATFRATGEDLREMLAFSLANGGRDTCQFSGFTATFSRKDGLVACSLEPDREYLVALPDYTAENAERYFGRPVEFNAGVFKVHQGILWWLREHPLVSKIPPRLTWKN